MIDLSGDFCSVIAVRIRSSNHEIARRWLQRLKEFLPIEVNDIFPSEQILDHVPALIQEIAEYMAADSADSVTANTAIQSKAHEMGLLRFQQQASVHQLLREYRFLGAVIADFVNEQVEQLPEPAPAAEAIRLLTRLNEAVFVLLQMTVDTFVGRYTERIEEQTTRLDGFNRMITHELRQPLSSVQYAIELIGSDSGEDEAKRRHYLDVGRRNIRRVADLIRMLGTLARPEADSLQLQTVDLSKLVTDAFRQVEEVAAAKGVALRHEIDPLDLVVDLSRLEIVLVNLLSNAIKYRDAAKPDAFVAVSLQRDETGTRLLVTDNGLGISAADQGQVFERFYRAHPDRDHALGNDGLGLGLSIVAECVKAMHASITVESTEGVGSTFIVALPDASAPAD